MTPPDIDSKPPLALTMGDPAGIGPEITKALWRLRRKKSLPPFFVIAAPSLYASLPVKTITSPDEAADVFDDALPVLPLPETVSATPGQPDAENAAMIIRSISLAVELVLAGQASAVVTNPISKHVLYEKGFSFPGHTEFLADLAQKASGRKIHPVMMLASEELRAIPLTIHAPLREVANLISNELINKTAHIIDHDLKAYFGFDSPRLCFCGLNPHAGENGAIGDEEQRIIIPALAQLAAEGLEVSGPFPADTLFHPRARKNYDAVIGMYHDQALIPLKMLAFDKGVNVTLGLPFVRTSPDHGTAFDIAGKGVANPSSLLEALKMADGMVRTAAGKSTNIQAGGQAAP